MRHRTLWIVALLLCILPACRFWLPNTAQNPDPNHTHADFAVWINGARLDFSGEQYMSGSSKAEPAGEHADDDHKHPSLHLHDGNGYVIHRHKPGLSLLDFLHSLENPPSTSGMTFAFSEREDGASQVVYGGPCPPGGPACGLATAVVHVYVNGKEEPEGLHYVFQDVDHVLVTTSEDPGEVQTQAAALTDDACLYSKTCPRRGDPPSENCVADPEVPCVE